MLNNMQFLTYIQFWFKIIKYISCSAVNKNFKYIDILDEAKALVITTACIYSVSEAV
jgi:hypothetical protein